MVYLWGCKKTRYLLAPPYCKTTETFVSPIPCSPSQILGGSKLAGGWRHFNNLRVIQTKNNFYIEVKMSIQEFLNVAKNYNKTSLYKAEFQIENLVNKRVSFAKLDMSKPHIMGVINLTPDSFYKNSQKTNIDQIKKVTVK